MRRFSKFSRGSAAAELCIFSLKIYAHIVHVCDKSKRQKKVFFFFIFLCKRITIIFICGKSVLLPKIIEHSNYGRLLDLKFSIPCSLSFSWTIVKFKLTINGLKFWTKKICIIFFKSNWCFLFYFKRYILHTTP